MSAKIFSLVLFALLTVALSAQAGAPDGQPFTSCPEGMQCIMSGGPSEVPPAEFGVEQLHVTSPASGEVKMSLSDALKIISRIPVPKVRVGLVFDQALWTLYAKSVFNELKLSAGSSGATAPPMDLPTKIALLNREVREGKARVKELERELSRLKRLQRRKG